MSEPDLPVTIVIRRRIKPGQEAAFEADMSDFLTFARAAEGNQGIHVLRPANVTDAAHVHDHPLVYTVVDRFSSTTTRRAFTNSDQYRQWMLRLRAHTEEDPHVEEMNGLAGWFTVPGEHHRPPTYKMAIVTFLGVYPLTSLLPNLIKRIIPDWHHLLANLVIAATVVSLLAWVVMPLLTRLFRPWLFAPRSASPRPAKS